MCSLHADKELNFICFALKNWHFFRAAQAEFSLNSLMRLKCLMLASCSVVCQMQRAEEAEMPLQPQGHAEQQQGFD